MKTIRRNRHAEGVEVDADGTWAISYGDMITVLLTFFILFFNVNKDKDSSKLLEEAMIIALSPPSSPREPAAVKVPPKTGAPVTSVNVGTDPGQAVEQDIASRLGAQVHKLGPRLLIDFPHVSFFEFGSIEVSAEGAAALRRFTDLYVPYAAHNQLVIRAYTDDKPVRGDVPGRPYKDNLELSLLRSLSAVRVMQKAGLPLNRMKPGGFGELRIPASEQWACPPGTSGNPFARKVVLMIEPEAKGSNL